MKLCHQLTAFADEELPRAEADRFREHLASCGACHSGLQFIWQADALAAPVLRARRRWLSPGHVAALVVLGVALAVGLLLTSCARGCPPVLRAPVTDVGDGLSRGRP